VLLDCGLFQGSRTKSCRRNRDIPFRPRDIDAVLLSHGDHGDLLWGLGPLAKAPRWVRRVHGEPGRAETLAEALRAAGFADVAVPDRGDSVTV
jgi:metallo-beta-lactamase family protein